MMHDKMFGQWVRRARRELDLTQEALAERVGCATSTIRTFESGARHPSRAMAERLADILAIPAHERAQFLKLARDRAAATPADVVSVAASPSDDERLTEPPAGAGPTVGVPRLLTSFVGRTAEVAELVGLLHDTRLLTLTGAGGAGKTRLALAVATQLAERYLGAVVLAELAPIAAPELVLQTVAAAAGAQLRGRRNLLDSLIERLGARETLLVLDNCEHLVATCARLVEQLLTACPDLRILATSREPLGVLGETIWLAPGLTLPDPAAPLSLETSGASDAVQLFVERARAQQPHFQLNAQNAAVVAQICRRLDGLPLAIELAAARIRMLGVAQIATRLDDALNLLTSGARTAAPRQQTLRGTLDWSYQLLAAEEQALLRQLAVFAGGWTLEAAEAVGATPAVLHALLRLVDQSLVAADAAGDGTLRYRLLEPIRQYAHAHLLASGEIDAVRERHAHYYLALTEATPPVFFAAQPAAGLRHLMAEADNVRAALHYLANLANPLPLARLCRSLGHFWEVAGWLREGRGWLERVLRRQAALPADLCAQLFYQAGELAVRQGDYSGANELYTQAIVGAQELAAEPAMLQLLAYARRGLGWSAYCQGDAAMAAHWYGESRALFQALEDHTGLARILISLGELAMLQGDTRTARALHTECLGLCRELGDRRGEAVELINLGWVELIEHHPAAARMCFRDGLGIALELADREHLSECLIGIAGSFGANTAGGAQAIRAARLIGAAAAIRAAIGVVAPAMYHERFAGIRASLEAQLGAPAFAAAWADGQALSIDRAIAEAGHDDLTT